VGRLQLSKLTHDGRGFIQIARRGVDLNQLHPSLDPNLLFLHVWKRFFQIPTSAADVSSAFLSDAQKRLRLPQGWPQFQRSAELWNCIRIIPLKEQQSAQVAASIHVIRIEGNDSSKLWYRQIGSVLFQIFRSRTAV